MHAAPHVYGWRDHWNVSFLQITKNRSCCDLPSALLGIEEGAVLLFIWAGLLCGGQIGMGESDWDDRKATGAGVLVRGDSAPGWRGVGGSRAGQEPDGQWL